HQETLLYMYANLPYEKKRRVQLPGSPVPASPGEQATQQAGNPLIDIPAGVATLGADANAIGFGWDNELPELRVDVAEFKIQKHNVTNGEYLEFVESGAPAPHFWLKQHGRWYRRSMFELEPLPLDA